MADGIAGMKTEYRIEMCGADGKWYPYDGGMANGVEDAVRIMAAAGTYYPERFGWRFRIVCRLVGEWCECNVDESKGEGE